MAAWGVVVPPGKVVPFVPPPDGGRLHLSQATLVPPTPASTPGRAILYARAGEGGDDVAVASLRGDGRGAECVGLDLIFDEYTEFRLVTAAADGDGDGAAPAVHLAGYHLPDFGDGEEEGDSDEFSSDDEEEAPLGVPIDGVASGSEDDDESEDVETGSEDDDDDDDDDSDALSESEGEEAGQAAARAAQGVVIEELPPDGGKAGGKAGASGSEAESESEDESGSESSDDDDGAAAASDDDADDEPPVAAPAWGEGAAPDGGAAAGGKRKAADAAAAPAPAPKKKAAAATAPPPPATPAPKKAAPGPPAPAPAPASKVRRYDNGFAVEEVAPGRPSGKRAAPGSRVEVRYTGRLAKTGKIFDATKGKATFKFRVGVGEVIKAWDRGIAGAVEGAKLKITAPPAMAYGAAGIRGAGGIPPNATLVFDVEVVRVF